MRVNAKPKKCLVVYREWASACASAFAEVTIPSYRLNELFLGIGRHAFKASQVFHPSEGSAGGVET